MEIVKQKRAWDGVDRRNKQTPIISRYSFWGGRRRVNSDQPQDSFVDVYSIKVWIALTFFLFLNLLDSHFTLIYLQRGGEEANPIALALLSYGPSVFILVKAVGVGLGACLFCVFKNFKNGRIGVVVSLLLYQLLLLYHLTLYLGLYPGSVSA